MYDTECSFMLTLQSDRHEKMAKSALAAADLQGISQYEGKLSTLLRGDLQRVQNALRSIFFRASSDEEVPVVMHLIYRGDADEPQRQTPAAEPTPAEGCARHAICRLGVYRPVGAGIVLPEGVQLQVRPVPFGAVLEGDCDSLFSVLTETVAAAAEEEQYVVVADIVANLPINKAQPLRRVATAED